MARRRPASGHLSEHRPLLGGPLTTGACAEGPRPPQPDCDPRPRGGFVGTAMRAGVPIAPVAVSGAEEAMPIFAHVPLLQRLTGLIYLPVDHAFPHFGAAGVRARIRSALDSLVRPGRPCGSVRVCRRGMRTHTKMRGLCLALFLIGAAGAVAGCGGEDFENEPRPPAAVTLTGVIQEEGVTVSPSNRGAGPFVITVSNQTDEARTLTLKGNSVEETVGPVQPQDTATIQATLEPGSYEVRAGSATAISEPIPPAKLTIGQPRASSSDELLLP